MLQALWDQGGSFVNDNTLTVTVKRLREKIDGPGAPRIATVRGMGYRLEVDAVSYTHLDVYKRQVTSISKSWRPFTNKSLASLKYAP